MILAMHSVLGGRVCKHMHTQTTHSKRAMHHEKRIQTNMTVKVQAIETCAKLSLWTELVGRASNMKKMEFIS